MAQTLIRNGLLMDTRAGELVGERDLLVDDGRIREVDDCGSIKAGGARMIDARGRVVMPGLCDAHVHVLAGSANLAAVQGWSPYYQAAKANEIMAGMLRRGFTTVRDTGGGDWGLQLAVEHGLIQGPRLIQGGPALSPTGGHADWRGPGESGTDICACCTGIGRVVDGVPEMLRACRDAIRRHAGHIKLVISGGVASPLDPITVMQFSAGEIAAAVEEADSAEIYVTAHGHPARAIKRALKLGIRCIEHGTMLDQECVDLFVEKDAWLVPTMSILECLNERGPEAGLPQRSMEKLAEVRPHAMASLEMAYRAGVKMAYGTDLLGILHDEQSREFRIRAEFMKPMEIIQQATLHAASLFRMDGEIGVLEPGARADILAIDGNPLDDLSLLEGQGRHMALIMKDGASVKNEVN
ncbi:MAG: amidohydrolase family protein [Sneathiellaceae bacterium]